LMKLALVRKRISNGLLAGTTWLVRTWEKSKAFRCFASHRGNCG
jgi:hypothetical protein